MTTVKIDDEGGVTEVEISEGSHGFLQHGQVNRFFEWDELPPGTGDALVEALSRYEAQAKIAANEIISLLSVLPNIEEAA